MGAFEELCLLSCVMIVVNAVASFATEGYVPLL